MSNPIAYAELHTPDSARAKEFYGRLFDWKLEDIPGGGYTLIRPGDGIDGGLMKDDFAGWQMYVTVADLASATRKAKELGARAVAEMQEVPGQGHYSVLVDPTGARFALWQKAK